MRQIARSSFALAARCSTRTVSTVAVTASMLSVLWATCEPKRIPANESPAANEPASADTAFQLFGSAVRKEAIATTGLILSGTGRTRLWGLLLLFRGRTRFRVIRAEPTSRDRLPTLGAILHRPPLQVLRLKFLDTLGVCAVSFGMDILHSMDWTNVAEIGAGVLLALVAGAVLYALFSLAVYVLTR